MAYRCVMCGGDGMTDEGIQKFWMTDKGALCDACFRTTPEGRAYYAEAQRRLERLRAGLPLDAPKPMADIVNLADRRRLASQ